MNIDEWWDFQMKQKKVSIRLEGRGLQLFLCNS